MFSIKQKIKYLLAIIILLFSTCTPQLSLAGNCPDGMRSHRSFGPLLSDPEGDCNKLIGELKENGATNTKCVYNDSNGYYYGCVNDDYQKATDTWSDSWIFKHALNPLLAGINSLLAKIIKIAANGTDAMLVMAFYIPDILKDVWQDLVNFANIILAGLLVLVSVMMVIGIKQDNYAIKKFMPNFIAALIMVNLSWVICWVVLDVGKILYEIMLNTFTGGADNLVSLMTMGQINDQTQIINDQTTSTAGGVLFTWLLFTLVLLFFMVKFGLQIFFSFVIRVVVLWMLFVISPLAWMAFAIPELRAKLFDKYFNALGTMAIMPAVVAFFLGLGYTIKDKMMDFLKENPDKFSSIPNADGSASDALSAVGNNFTSTIASFFGFNNGMSFWQVMIVYMIVFACLKLAADYGLKNEFTAQAMDLGGKVFDMGKNALNRARKTATGVAGKAGKYAGKKAVVDPLRRTYKKAALKIGKTSDELLKGDESGRKAWKEGAGQPGFKDVWGGAKDIGKKAAGMALGVPGYMAARNKRVEAEEANIDKAREGRIGDLAEDRYKKATGYHRVEEAQKRVDEHDRNIANLNIALKGEKDAERRTEIENQIRDEETKKTTAEGDLNRLQQNFFKYAKGSATDQFRFSQAASAAGRADIAGKAAAKEELGDVTGDDATTILKSHIDAALTDPKLFDDWKYRFRYLFEQASENGDFNKTFEDMKDELKAKGIDFEKTKLEIWGKDHGLAIGGLRTKDENTIFDIFSKKNADAKLASYHGMMDDITKEVEKINADGSLDDATKKAEIQRLLEKRGTAIRGAERSLAVDGNMHWAHREYIDKLNNIGGGYGGLLDKGAYGGFDIQLNNNEAQSEKVDVERQQSMTKSMVKGKNQAWNEVDGAAAVMMREAQEIINREKRGGKISLNERRLMKGILGRLQEIAGNLGAKDTGLEAINEFLAPENMKSLVKVLGEDGRNEFEQLMQVKKGILEVGGRAATRNMLQTFDVKNYKQSEDGPLEGIDENRVVKVDVSTIDEKERAGEVNNARGTDAWEERDGKQYIIKIVKEGRKPKYWADQLAIKKDGKNTGSVSMRAYNTLDTGEKTKALKDVVQYLANFMYKENLATIKDPNEHNVVMQLVNQLMETSEFKSLLESDSKFKADFDGFINNKLKATEQENYFEGDPVPALRRSIEDILKKYRANDDLRDVVEKMEEE